MRPLSLEYVAGFFDGEGSIGVYSSGRGRHVLRVQITQNATKHSTPLLENFRDRWGGGLTLMTGKRERPAWNYQVNGATAIKMLKEIRPFLILKGAEADAVFEWWDGRGVPQRGPDGRMLPRSREGAAWDETYAALLKSLKRVEYT